jgi:D-3-phosphoglycerate dehydrogenase / 2-oxoglutarate reductase
MNHKIFILEPAEYSPSALKVYGDIGSVDVSSEMPENLWDKGPPTVLVCRLGYHLDAVFLQSFSRLQFIVSPTTGLNHIDLQYCEANQVRVISLKGETDFLDSIRSTSELAFTLILALVRNIVPGSKSVRRGEWNRDEFKGRELGALTLGVLGVGRIGRHIISFAKAFGMSVLACDPYVDPKSLPGDHVQFCSQNQLFSIADIVTVHVDYRPENNRMITRKDFERMKPGGYFINTSRGELVSEEDIIWALEKGRLSGAGLDVLADEQDGRGLFNKKIIEYAKRNDNLIITPHLGGCTLDAMHKTELFAAEKLKQVINAVND